MNRKMNKLYITAVGVVLLLSGSGLLLAQSSLPPAKRAIKQQYSQERAAGAANPAPANPNAPYPIVHELPFPAGIMIDCSPPFPNWGVIANCWYGIANGFHTIVYTGRENDEFDPQQGEVFVVTLPEPPASTSVITLLTPVKGGSVRIVAAKDNVLTLASDTGYVLTFDVASRKFTSYRIPGDLNGDGVVDQKDLNLILHALNQPAAKPFDPRDLNYDGVINVLDARKLILLCTHPRCASQ